MKKQLLLIIYVALLLLGCQGTSQQNQQPIVAVSLPPQKFFVERIAGDSLDVHLLVPSGDNPEHFDPTPHHIATLQKCDAYFAVGTLPFELEWIEMLQGSEVEVVNIATELPQELIFGADAEHAHTHVHGDPHYWSSFSGGKAMATTIYQHLTQLYPQWQEYFTTNFQTLEAEIDALYQQAKATLKQGDTEGQSFVIYHPSLSLFAQEMGLTQLVIEEKGSVPTPRHLARLIDAAKQGHTRVVFIQEEFETRSAETIAKELGITPTTIQPLAENWLHEMQHIVESFGNP